MNLADVLSITLLIIGLLIVYVAYWLMSAGLFPRFATRTAEQIAKAPVKTALVGLVTLAPLVVIGLAISSKVPNGAIKLAGITVVLLALLAALFGSAGLALRIGQGLESARDEDEPWRRVLRGGVVLSLTFAMPLLGWFVLMPFAYVVGFGAFLLCLERSSRSVPVSAPTAVPPLPESLPVSS